MKTVLFVCIMNLVISFKLMFYYLSSWYGKTEFLNRDHIIKEIIVNFNGAQLCTYYFPSLRKPMLKSAGI